MILFIVSFSKSALKKEERAQSPLVFLEISEAIDEGKEKGTLSLAFFSLKAWELIKISEVLINQPQNLYLQFGFILFYLVPFFN